MHDDLDNFGQWYGRTDISDSVRHWPQATEVRAQYEQRLYNEKLLQQYRVLARDGRRAAELLRMKAELDRLGVEIERPSILLDPNRKIWRAGPTGRI